MSRQLEQNDQATTKSFTKDTRKKKIAARQYKVLALNKISAQSHSRKKKLVNTSLILATLDFNPPAVGDFISHTLIKDTLNLKLLLKDSFQVGDTIICFVVAVNLVVRDGGPNHVGVRACMRPSRLNCINVIVCKAIGQR